MALPVFEIGLVPMHFSQVVGFIINVNFGMLQSLLDGHHPDDEQTRKFIARLRNRIALQETMRMEKADT